ncbi:MULTISPECIES: AfsR/SARP family transcriptional regulator [Catenuloplanes]|uniref:ATPase/DNA-binding SARP family transcriptional activator n=1 Tax=Catenuloplanes niger TaxID=587534 RepID=A0AAE3ZZZ8_9ACTN|nr:BTAD domain-containing putative transcriptional regulator [Catenuloplanes niger]MDR7327083.1 putative ATPase/DNA-binding SARP family transcriptional activator [Catenuloplanes niger]
MLTFAVLGPLEVRDGDRRVELGGRLPRRLLALLLAADGQPVGDDRLADGVWAGRPPREPTAALQVYVSRLRRVLPGAGLRRADGGYRLAAGTDAGRFAEHAARARALAAAGRPGEAHAAFEAALRLWRGEPYPEIADVAAVSAVRAELAEHRESAREDGVAALLDAGDHATAAAVLEGLVRDAPYRERRWQLLALALYRAGRQAEALAAVRRARTLLAGELGVDPGPQLRDVERRILTHDPTLLPAGGDRPRRPRPLPTPPAESAPPPEPAPSDEPAPLPEPAPSDEPAPPAEPAPSAGRAPGPGPRGNGRVPSPSAGREPDPEPVGNGRTPSSSAGREPDPEPVGNGRTPSSSAGREPDPEPPRDGRRGGRALSSFVGRAADLALLGRLMAAHRLVTVLGPAGVGKTRLAAEWAPAGTLIRLADVTDPALLVPALAAAAGVTGPVRDPRAALVDRLRRLREPLVLDNCEHLADHVARLLVDLLDRVPGLRVLATSRTPLGIDGEHVLPLAPLAPPDAVTLLTDRIRAVRPGWTPAATDRHDLRNLADALDRLPLALELAAARARTFGLRELTGRLDDRFALLGRIPRGAVTPHATLHEAVAWSFDLLSDAERELAVRLWPYEGGFGLEVAGDRLDDLAALCDQSVVTADTGTVPVRYRMLETIRAYARAIDADPDRSRAAHAAWVRGLVAEAAADLRGKHSADAMDRLRRELPNIRAAIAHDLAHAPAHALRTAAELMWFWVRGGLPGEGDRVLSAALAAAPDAPLEDVVRAETALGGLRYVAGDVEAARRMLSGAARTVTGATSHRVLLAEVRYYQGLVQVPSGDAEIALSAAAEALDIAVETGTGWLVAASEMTLGAALVLAGLVGAGQERLRAAVRHGYTWTAALSELMLGQTMVAAGDRDAIAVLWSSLRRFRDEGDLSNVLAVLHNGALALDAAGDHDGAAVLHAVVRIHHVRNGIQPAGAYIGTDAPPARPAGDPPADPPSLADAIAVLEAAAARHAGTDPAQHPTQVPGSALRRTDTH